MSEKQDKKTRNFPEEFVKLVGNTFITILDRLKEQDQEIIDLQNRVYELENVK